MGSVDGRRGAFKAGYFPFVLTLTALAMVVNLYLMFLWAPTESTMGNVQRIFYFHVPSAALADVAFTIGGISALLYLRAREPMLDELSLACNETGLIFQVVNIVMGCMWARPVWGIWWTWDARLTSAFIMVLIYSGYLIARSAIDEPTQRANICAVLSVLGLVDMPIVYLSNRLFRTQHPKPVIFGDKDSGLDAHMTIVLLFSMATFALLLFCLARTRRRVAALERETHALQMHAMELTEFQTR